jgi:hypothetical protein
MTATVRTTATIPTVSHRMMRKRRLIAEACAAGRRIIYWATVSRNVLEALLPEVLAIEIVTL